MTGRTITPVLFAVALSSHRLFAAGLYVIAASACAVAPGAPTPPSTDLGVAPLRRIMSMLQQRPWSVMAITIAGLGIARAFDIGRHVGNVFRRAAYSEGWYERRRPLQTAVVIVAIVAMSMIAASIVRMTRNHGREMRAAIVSVSMLVALAAMRAISLHDIDGMLARHDRAVIVAEGAALVALSVSALTARGVGIRAR